MIKFEYSQKSKHSEAKVELNINGKMKTQGSGVLLFV